eukprot:symbB.v1.2.030895.t1/scaffold3528.1/size54678/1
MGKPYSLCVVPIGMRGWEKSRQMMPSLCANTCMRFISMVLMQVFPKALRFKQMQMMKSASGSKRVFCQLLRTEQWSSAEKLITIRPLNQQLYYASRMTLSNDDPKNLVLLCTSEGTALQQQGVGYQKLFLHEKKADEQIARRWLEAKSTGHKVGGAQEESWEAAVESAEAAAEAQRVLQEAKAKEDPGDEELERLKDKAAKLEVEANERRLRAAEAEEAAKEGKAVARRFGIDAMGSRCNMLMTIQVPLQQQEKPPPMPSGSGFAGEVCGIDFGTTNCRVALWKDGGVTVVPNAMGNFNTPCCVAAKDGELLVGEAAEAAKWDAVHTGPENFVDGPKRFLGRTWSELSAKQMCLAAPLKAQI